jgi:hypothetical protein
VEEEGVVIAPGSQGREVFAGLCAGLAGKGGRRGEEGYLWGVFVIEFYYYCALFGVSIGRLH